MYSVGKEMFCSFVLFVWCLGTVNTEKPSAQFPRGHLQPVGNQKDIVRGKITELNHMISGVAFYKQYFIREKPVVFRGVLNRTKALKNWVNATYMRENFGSIRGMVDRRKTWERGGLELPPRSFMSYSEFLDRFEKQDLYWDQEIPLDHPILRDMPMPLALNCEETRSTFFYVNLMVNSGNVSYVLHRDHGDNFFLFIGGQKRWLIADSRYRDSAYIGEGTEAMDLSPVNADSVDLIKYPKMSEIDFHEIFLRPGDILYVPRNWLHYVKSGVGSPNMGMNIWFGGNPAMHALRKIEFKCARQRKSLKTILKTRK